MKSPLKNPERTFERVLRTSNLDTKSVYSLFSRVKPGSVHMILSPMNLADFYGFEDLETLDGEPFDGN
jgi:hypothetical protein